MFSWPYIGLVEAGTPNSAVYGYQVLLGLGAGCFVHAGFAVVQANVRPEDSVHGVTLMMLGQLSGLAYGLSMTGAVFLNLALRNLAVVFPDVGRDTLVEVISGTSGAFLATLSEEERAQALGAIVSAMQKPFMHVYVAAALGLVLSLFLKVSCVRTRSNPLSSIDLLTFTIQWKKAYAVAAGGA